MCRDIHVVRCNKVVAHVQLILHGLEWQAKVKGQLADHVVRCGGGFSLPARQALCWPSCHSRDMMHVVHTNAQVSLAALPPAYKHASRDELQAPGRA